MKYTSDAYHSLSIEGYRVNVELIERVRDGSWHPDQIEQDRKHRDAIAARGYWLAFQEVRKSVERILNRHNSGDVAVRDHGDWFRALFTPGVEVNILTDGDLAGYRGDQVYIQQQHQAVCGVSGQIPIMTKWIAIVLPKLKNGRSSSSAG